MVMAGWTWTLIILLVHKIALAAVNYCGTSTLSLVAACGFRRLLDILIELAEDFIGFGRFQVCLLVIAGFGFMADAIEVGVWAKMHRSCMSVRQCDLAPGFSVQDVITSGFFCSLDRHFSCSLDTLWIRMAIVFNAGVITFLMEKVKEEWPGVEGRETGVTSLGPSEQATQGVQETSKVGVATSSSRCSLCVCIIYIHTSPCVLQRTRWYRLANQCLVHQRI